MPEATKPGCEVLAQTAAFSGLEPRCYNFLATRATERTSVRGDVVFAEDCIAEGLYLIVRGCVQLTRAAPCGSILLGAQSAPALILTAGFLDGSANDATAVALSDCSTLVLGRETFHKFCRKNPEVLLRLLAEIGIHLHRTAGFIDLITTADTRQRLARALLDLMEDCGGTEFILPCSHGKLAVRLGTVREVVARNLKSLENEGAISTSGLKVTVRNAQVLARAAGIAAGAVRIFEPRAVPPIPAYFVLDAIASARECG